MPLSRLRLRLAARFALAFAVALALLAAASLGFLWRESNRRLDERLQAITRGSMLALGREILETPDSSLAYAANEVAIEWPTNDESFAIVGADMQILASADRARVFAALRPALAAAGDARTFVFESDGRSYRAAVLAPRPQVVDGKMWVAGAVAYHNMASIESDTRLLASGLAIAAPLIVLLSLGAGYVLARGALKPMVDLRGSIAGIAPGTLNERLPVTEPADEIGALAAEFNSLLERLDAAQKRNTRFVREAAHQIRTPLTLVLGEAAHELASEESNLERSRAALTRVRTAAEQMTHRVNDLFLLAEAQAGESIRLTEDVELDGLVLECADLMRSRASALGRTLALGRVEPIVVRGNSSLLREAVLELIENACKHGTSDAPVTIAVYPEGGKSVLSVESAGAPLTLRAETEPEGPNGLGIPIVRWIARGHHGELVARREGNLNVLCVVLP